MEDPVLKKSFLTSMRGIASTVNVISAISNGEKHAMTATSVNSLSIDPLCVLLLQQGNGVHVSLLLRLGALRWCFDGDCWDHAGLQAHQGPQQRR